MTEINELCRDIQMKLPDEIWMLDSLERLPPRRRPYR